MAHELAVWLFAEQVGTLSLVDGRLSFAYHPGWLANPDAVALSGSLPLQAAPFDDIRTRPFFAGLLPEGHLRRLIAQRLQVSRQNDFALLDAIGGECAGAVSLLPKDALPQVAGAGEVSWLNDQRLSAILDELPRRPMLAGQDGLRLSLAGAQDKLPVVFDGQRIGLPLGGQPSTHILKPPLHAASRIHLIIPTQHGCLIQRQVNCLPSVAMGIVHKIAGDGIEPSQQGTAAHFKRVQLVHHPHKHFTG